MHEVLWEGLIRIRCGDTTPKDAVGSFVCAVGLAPTSGNYHLRGRVVESGASQPQHTHPGTVTAAWRGHKKTPPTKWPAG